MDGQRPMVPSKEELEMIRDYCILPQMLKTVQKNRTDMEFTDNTLKRLYMKAADRLWEQIEADRRRIKKELDRIGCKVKEIDRHDPAALHFEFWLRGYHEEFGIMKFLIVSEIGIRLGQYIAEMFNKQ